MLFPRLVLSEELGLKFQILDSDQYDTDRFSVAQYDWFLDLCELAMGIY